MEETFSALQAQLHDYLQMEVFPDADWQRCAVHFYRNVFSHVPNHHMGAVGPGC